MEMYRQKIRHKGNLRDADAKTYVIVITNGDKKIQKVTRKRSEKKNTHLRTHAQTRTMCLRSVRMHACTYTICA